MLPSLEKSVPVKDDERPKKANAFSLPFFSKQQSDEGKLNPIGPKENVVLKTMHFGLSERQHFFELFQELANDGSSFGFNQFVNYFQFSSTTAYIRRTFDLINIKQTGSPTFLEFLKFCERYLVIDQTTTEEFCFRILSRRGSNFLPQYSVLDLEDLVTFVTLKYGNVIKVLPKQRKLAVGIFDCIVQEAKDDGINFAKFQEFCRKNPAFLRLTHPIQNHLRKCLFSIECWVEKSRKVKASQNVSVMNMILGSNRVSEQYTLYHIEDPVIDEQGYPIKAPKKKKKRNTPTTANEGKQQEETDAAPKTKNNETLLLVPAMGEATTTTTTATRREYLAFLEPFSFDQIIESYPLAKDFPIVLQQRTQKKQQRLELLVEQQQAIKSIGVQMYDKLIQACTDLIYHRRDTRKAFEQWLRAVELIRLVHDKQEEEGKNNNSNTNSSDPATTAVEKTKNDSNEVHQRIVRNNERLFQDREDEIVITYANQHFQSYQDR